jgi:hypothetical protein
MLKKKQAICIPHAKLALVDFNDIPRGAVVIWVRPSTKEGNSIVLYRNREHTVADTIMADMHTTSRPLDELLECTDAWSFSENERHELYYYISGATQRMQMSALQELMQKYDECLGHLREIKDINSLKVMRQSSVVGITTTSASIHRRLLHALAPRVILFEEAAQVLEAHVLAALSPRTQHLIMIGDHKQLRCGHVCMCACAADQVHAFFHHNHLRLGYIYACLCVWLCATNVNACTHAQRYRHIPFLRSRMVQCVYIGHGHGHGHGHCHLFKHELQKSPDLLPSCPDCYADIYAQCPCMPF